mgnify:FL=1
MKINKILVAAAMALGFVSCSSEGELTPAIDTLKDTPLQINASVAGMKTRAGYDANSVFDKFYLKIRQGTKEQEKYWYDVVMKLENGQWVAYDAETETKTVQLLRAGYNITCELYPSTFTGYKLDDHGNQIKSIELEVLADQSLDASVKASDHLYALNKDKNMEVKAIELKLEHQMSKLSLELTLGSEYKEEQNPVKDMQIVGTKRKVKWSDGYSYDSDDASAEPIIPYLAGYTKPTDDSPKAKVCYEVILAPQTVEAGNFGVEFNVLGKTYRWYSDAAVKLEEGTQYTLQLTAGKDQANLVEVTSKAWNTKHKNENNEEVDNKSDIETF